MDFEYAAEIRNAIRGEDYSAAMELWTRCAERLESGVRDRTLGEDALREVHELVTWSRQVLLCARSHAQDRLRTMHVARAYETPADSARGWLRTSL